MVLKEYKAVKYSRLVATTPLPQFPVHFTLPSQFFSLQFFCLVLILVIFWYFSYLSILIVLLDFKFLYTASGRPDVHPLAIMPWKRSLCFFLLHFFVRQGKTAEILLHSSETDPNILFFFSSIFLLMFFSAFFLVWDWVRWQRSNCIPVKPTQNAFADLNHWCILAAHQNLNHWEIKVHWQSKGG